MQSPVDYRQSSSDLHHTDHAQMRMGQRGSSERYVAMVLRYGRTVHARGAAYRVIGHKEVARCAELGIDVSEADGVHVLVAPRWLGRDCLSQPRAAQDSPEQASPSRLSLKAGSGELAMHMTLTTSSTSADVIAWLGSPEPEPIKSA